MPNPYCFQDNFNLNFFAAGPEWHLHQDSPLTSAIAFNSRTFLSSDLFISCAQGDIILKNPLCTEIKNNGFYFNVKCLTILVPSSLNGFSPEKLLFDSNF